MPGATTSATTALSALPLGLAQPNEVFTARFTTVLTAPIPSALRPINIAVANTLPAFGAGTFSIAIFDAGTDASPQNFEALEVIVGGASLSWTVVTEAGWTANAHASGSTVVATVLTPRSIQQPLNNHINPSAIPDPHSIYIKKSVVTNKGNLIVGTGNGTITNLPSGPDGTIPVADSAQVAGIRWAISAIAGVLTHMGDLIVGGVLGVSSRLGIGAVGQVLTAVQQPAAIADPVSAPSCSATGSGGALVNGISYDFTYAWQNGTTPDGGITLSSPITTFIATTTGTVSVQCPAAPASNLTLLVYAAVHLTALQLEGSLSNPSTGASNTIAISAINAGAARNTTNTTGGVSAQWGPIPASVSNSIRLGASASMQIGVVQTTLVNPMTTTGDLITGGTSGTPTRLGPGASATVLQSNGAGQALTWAAQTGGTVSVSVRLVATASMNIGAAQTLLTNPMTTTGDLITGGAGGAATRLAASAAGTFLQSNGAGLALSWGTASSGGGGGGGGGGSGALAPLQVIGPLTAAQATMTFSSIPQTGFRNLRLSIQARGTTAATDTRLLATFNNDTGASYNWSFSITDNGTIGSGSRGAGDTAMTLASIASASAPSNAASGAEIQIRNYVGTTNRKELAAYGTLYLADTAGNFGETLCMGIWKNTASISTISLSLAAGNFDVGSYVCLYGEMDTAGVLLTPASNLLYDSGPLTSAQATISTGPLSQAYRDLRVVVDARGDTAATQTQLQLQVNGDTGSNYSSLLLQNNTSFSLLNESLAVAQWSVADIAGNTAVSGDPGSISIYIPDYIGTTFNKTFRSTGGVRLATGTGNTRQSDSFGLWANTAAVTSLLFRLAAGNFAAGTTIRVYGEPASAGGASVGTGTRLRISTNQPISAATPTAINWDTEDIDADNQHYTSAAILTGSVAKSAASQTLTGTSTLFTKELSVGQIISVTGVTTEKRVVTAIASDTSLTVNTAFVNTTSGQIATRINSAVVFRQPGFYTLEANIYSAGLPTQSAGTIYASATLVANTGVATVWTNNGTPQVTAGSAIADVVLRASATMNPVGVWFGTGVTLAYWLNNLTTSTSGTVIGQRDPIAVNVSAGYDLVVQRQFQQWDFVEVVWTQNSGSTVNILADERTHWSISARPTVIVAVPYIKVVDRKTAGTDGGTFTAGADRTRDLTFVESDSAGICTLATNQITLPSGTYEVEATVPAFAVEQNVAWLYNVTDAAILVSGQNAYSRNSNSPAIVYAPVRGKFTLNGTKVLEIRHRCATTEATNGFGIAINSQFSVPFEYYTTVILHKVG